MSNRLGVLTGFLFSFILTACQSQSAEPVAATQPSVQPVVVQPNIPSHVFNIVDFGAVGDGYTDNTASFAKAMAACSAAGGGRVVAPAGSWFTGPIHLISNLDFHLDAGATILYSRKFDDYPLVVGNYEGQQAVISTSPLSGDQLHDLQITGQGIIDGQGDAWRQVKKSTGLTRSHRSAQRQKRPECE
jgi:polygalacturonase